jgi:NAD(P)-dependent dehydrogenase (short-subunit alcohol dehydrogenase family)
VCSSDLVAGLRDEGLAALALHCDVRSPGSVDTAVAAVCDRFGGIDILVNNAGLHSVAYNQPVTQLPLDDWSQLLDVNVMGPVRCAKACRETMRQRGGGVIINMSSIAALPALNAYGVSKLAMRGLTTALATELGAEGTRVYGLAPGLIGTDAVLSVLSAEQVAEIQGRQLIPRQGRLEDVVAAMLFCCSEGASFITGETISVSGGFPLHL